MTYPTLIKYQLYWHRVSTGLKRIRVSTLVIICLIIFALCFIRGLRNVANDGDVAVMSIKRFVNQHKRTLEEQFGMSHPKQGPHRRAIHRLSNLWVADEHPDSLKMDELDHCTHHVMHKLVELGLAVDKRDIKDMRHMNRTHEVDCTSYRHSSELRRQVHANVLEMPSVSAADTVTLVTHLTSDRYSILLDVMKHWDGPVSVAVYVKEMEDLEQFAGLVCSSYIEHNWKDFHLHFVKEEGVFYPVNYLRNTAMNRVQTDYMFIMDVDFVPMPYSYETLHHYTSAGLPRKNEVLVVPAFELLHEKRFDITKFPQHKEEALIMWRDGEIEPFHMKVFAHGHKPTDYARWIHAKQPYEVEWKRWYEPYVVIRTDATPKFDKRFVERGFDKSSYVMQLHAMGFKFIVVPNVFILHAPHTLANTESFRDMRLNRCSKEVYEDFLHMLQTHYHFHLTKEDTPT